MTGYVTTETVTYLYNERGLLLEQTSITVCEELPPEEPEPKKPATREESPLHPWAWGGGIMPCKGTKQTTTNVLADDNVVPFLKRSRMTNGYL